MPWGEHATHIFEEDLFDCEEGIRKKRHYLKCKTRNFWWVIFSEILSERWRMRKMLFEMPFLYKSCDWLAGSFAPSAQSSSSHCCREPTAVYRWFLVSTWWSLLLLNISSWSQTIDDEEYNNTIKYLKTIKDTNRFFRYFVSYIFIQVLLLLLDLTVIGMYIIPQYLDV